MGGEDLVGLAADEEVERAAEDFAHRLAHDVVPVVERPAAVFETAGRVFFRAARRLHHAIEAKKHASDLLFSVSELLIVLKVTPRTIGEPRSDIPGRGIGRP